MFGKGNPYWNFEEIKAIEDGNGVRSTWFFLDESFPFEPLHPKTWKLSLGRYSIQDRSIVDAIRKLDSGGWEIGLHGSYRSYRDESLLRKEKHRLEEVLGHEVRGVRQHYLNLEIPRTWKLQRNAGLTYDASFGFRRGLGWRAGHHLPFYDPDSGMGILPLAIMECNLFQEAGGDVERAWCVAKEIMGEAERRRAVLTVLWHPHVFSESDFPGYAEIYKRIIEEGRRRGATFSTAGECFKTEPPSASGCDAGEMNPLTMRQVTQ